MYSVTAFQNPKEFQKFARPLLMQSEGANNLLLGIIDVLVKDPDFYPDRVMLLVREEHVVVGVAVMTRPHPMQISNMPLPAVIELVRFVARETGSISGVGGPMPVVATFAWNWVDLWKSTVHTMMKQGIYQLEHMAPISASPGLMRVATEGDLALVEEWTYRFYQDAGTTGDLASAYRSARNAIANGTRYLWEVDGTIRSMAGLARPTDNGYTVNAVYTPPCERGRGYATSLVWRMSQKVLDSGKRYCFLYTDLANPTSNGIYRKIGYRQITEAAHFEFAS